MTVCSKLKVKTHFFYCIRHRHRRFNATKNNAADTHWKDTNKHWKYFWKSTKPHNTWTKKFATTSVGNHVFSSIMHSRLISDYNWIQAICCIENAPKCIYPWATKLKSTFIVRFAMVSNWKATISSPRSTKLKIICQKPSKCWRIHYSK